MSVHKNFGSENFGSKYVLFQRNVGSKKNLDEIFCPKIIWSKKLHSKIFWSKNCIPKYYQKKYIKKIALKKFKMDLSGKKLWVGTD